MQQSALLSVRELLAHLLENPSSEVPFPEHLNEYLQDFVPSRLLQSHCFQIAFGVRDAEMEALYAKAYELYHAENYLIAANLFRWLVLLNPFVTKYWMGLGASQQLINDCKKALECYAVAYVLDDNSPYPHFYAYECYEAMGEESDALIALQMASERALRDEKYAELAKEVQEISHGRTR